MGRIGDYSNKQYLYKVYRKGYSSWKPNYIDIAAGQYIGTTLNLTQETGGQSFEIDNFDVDFETDGGGGSRIGTITSDKERSIDIKGVVAIFHPYNTIDYDPILEITSESYFELFDYKVVYYNDQNVVGRDPEVLLYKRGVLVDTQNMSSSYNNIRIREENDVLYIEYSSDGETWTIWDSYVIDYDNDIINSQLVFGFDISMSGAWSVSTGLGDVLVYDKGGQLLAVETENVISPLEFNTEINTPASETTITLNYSPDEVPSHITIGNNIEVYANFYDWSSETDYEPILDENSQPILDQNSQPIYGKVLNQGAPENLNNLRFAGYIEDIEYDYDNMTTSVKLVSHGEIMANALIHSDEPEDVSVLSQLLDNASLTTSAAHYQTFRLYKNTRIDKIAMKFGVAGGGAAEYQILSSTGATVLGTTRTISWSGALSTGVYDIEMTEPLYLETGVYRLRLNTGGGTTTYRYQNTNVYPDGSWSGGAGDLYFNLITSQYSYNVTITGNSNEVIDTAFRYLEENYTLLRKGDVDTSSYDVTVESNIDTVLSLVNNTQKRMDSGWWWHVDPGTNELRFKSQDTTPDHLLVLGRDFTEFKLKKSIADIANIGLFSGGPLVEDGANIAVLAIDNDSIAKYKRGLVIESNEKVTRYDSANLLINNTISNNNKPRYTTTITVEASLYDIETFRIGDLVKISNIGVEPNLSLTIAGIGYSPDKVTLSLDTAPTTINVTVEALRRQLENSATANIGDVS